MNETQGAWNWGNVQSAGGGFLVVGDKLSDIVQSNLVFDLLRIMLEAEVQARCATISLASSKRSSLRP